MQFRIIFRVMQPGQLLPLSYQYELSAWIYKLIGDANSEFASFLHDQGYTAGSKRFKLFTFSSLFVAPPFRIIDDRMKVMGDHISFVLSFFVPEAAQNMITSLFSQQSLTLGDRISQVDLTVQSVEMLPPVVIDTMPVRLKATSPILVSRPQTRPGGKLIHDYLHPEDAAYPEFFFKNLLDKYEAALQHQLVEPLAKPLELHFRLLSQNPKKRGIRIKAHTKSETKLIGYLYDFELTAPIPLIRFGMLAGFGGENALGFGATKLLTS